MYRFRVDKGPKLLEFLAEQKATSSSFEFQSHDQLANWVIDNLKTQSNDKQQSSLLTLELEGPLIQKLASESKALPIRASTKNFVACRCFGFSSCR